ncbi:MAG TPA: hypothetical protein VHL80_01800 [Polyangia bacterium]|nr:hypothetical protein [Polyangia bacterium]
MGAGCGGVTAAADGGNDAPAVTTEEACNKVAKALCDALNGCAPFYVSEQYGDEPTCITRAALSCMTDQSTGGITRTPADLVACAQAATGIDCTDALAGNYPAACDPKPGTIINGMACGSNLQCQSTYCNKTGMCGVCGPRQDAGKACTTNDGCLKGLVCASSVCVKPAGPSEACNLPGQPCRTDLACSSSTAPGTCVAKVGVGGACADNGDLCDFTKGSICNTLATPKVCIAINVAKPGDSCSLASKTGCVGGIDPCSSILLGGVCANPAEDGAACGDNAVCIPPATCVDKVCRLPSAPNCM